MLRARTKLLYAGAITASAAILIQKSSTISNDTLPQAPLEKPKKSKPTLPQSSLSADYPGVYAWGNNTGNVIAQGQSSNFQSVKSPYRIPYFDGRLLKDLQVTPGLGVAVLENGDVVQWGDEYATEKEPEKIIKGRNITKVQIAKGKAVYGLNNSGSKVYAWPVSRKDFTEGSNLGTAAKGSSWWKIWTWGSSGDSNDAVNKGSCLTVKLPSLGYTEYIKDISVGNDHILVLTSRGRVFSGSTGVYPDQKPKASKGQYGIAALSQFDDAPTPGSVYEIKSFRDSVISKIATGDFHSLALTKDGKVYGFGENLYGQLGLPYSYSTANAAIPTLLPFQKMYPRRVIAEAVDIAAGGSTSYVVLKPRPNPHELVEKKTLNDDFHREVYGFGEGLAGQLGTGAFVHAQSSPVKLKHFANLVEYSEALRQMVNIDLAAWSVGKSHIAVTIGDNIRASQFGRDVLLWGGNEFSQIGTGKKNNISKPIGIPHLDVDRAPSKSAVLPSVAGEDSSEWQTSDLDAKNDKLRLVYGKKVHFTDPDSHKSRSAKVSQEIVAGEDITAVYYKRV